MFTSASPKPHNRQDYHLSALSQLYTKNNYHPLSGCFAADVCHMHCIALLVVSRPFCICYGARGSVDSIKPSHTL